MLNCRIYSAALMGLILTAVIATPAFAQCTHPIPACLPVLAYPPQIDRVVSAADFKIGVGWGSIGTIFGSGLWDANYPCSGQPAASCTAWTVPYPLQLSMTRVFLCLPGYPNASLPDINSTCEALGLLFAEPSQINFLMPDKTPSDKPWLVENSVVRVVVGNNPNSEPINDGQGLFANAGPRVFTVGYDCFIDPRFPDANKNCGLRLTTPTSSATRGAITDPQGRVLFSSNPARIGQYYTIWLTQLPKVALSVEISDLGRVMSTVVPAYAGPSPQFPGLYQVNFQMPGGFFSPALPCGDSSWEFSLSLVSVNGGQSFLPSSPAVQIPVVIKKGDVACAQ